MRCFIHLSPQQYASVWAHLLPDGATRESAAFLFASFTNLDGELILYTEDYLLVEPSGFMMQLDDYIELSDETRISIIKKAHRSRTALIEMHSHPFNGPGAAAFSAADMRGFAETVPHMWWRLPNRPYAAVVVAPAGFDAMVWVKDPRQPEAITALRVANKTLSASNLTLEGRQYGTRT
jgi:hypothetical protein